MLEVLSGASVRLDVEHDLRPVVELNDLRWLVSLGVLEDLGNEAAHRCTSEA